MNGNYPQWAEFFVYGITFNTIAVGTGLAYTDGEIRIDSDAEFEFMKTMYFSTNDLADTKIKYKDDSSGRYLMKSATSLRSIGGRSLPIDGSNAFDFRPFVWPAPYTIRRATTLGVQIANSHAIITPTVYLAFHGGKLRDGLAPWKRPGYRKMPYVYPLSRNLTTIPEGTVRVAANQTVSVSIQTDKDSDFIVRQITGSSTGGALVTVQDMGRDRQWMNVPTHIRNLIGSGAFPNKLATPRFVTAGSVISVQIQDISGAQNDVEFNLVGEKLYKMR